MFNNLLQISVGVSNLLKFEITSDGVDGNLILVTNAPQTIPSLDLKIELYDSQYNKLTEQPIDKFTNQESILFSGKTASVYYLKVYHKDNTVAGNYIFGYDFTVPTPEPPQPPEPVVNITDLGILEGLGSISEVYQIDPIGNYDIFKFETTASSTSENYIRITNTVMSYKNTGTADLDLKVEVYDSNLVMLNTTNDKGETIPFSIDKGYDEELISLNGLPSGVYHIKIYHADNTKTGNYTISYNAPFLYDVHAIRTEKTDWVPSNQKLRDGVYRFVWSENNSQHIVNIKNNGDTFEILGSNVMSFDATTNVYKNNDTQEVFAIGNINMETKTIDINKVTASGITLYGTMSYLSNLALRKFNGPEISVNVIDSSYPVNTDLVKIENTDSGTLIKNRKLRNDNYIIYNICIKKSALTNDLVPDLLLNLDVNNIIQESNETNNIVSMYSINKNPEIDYSYQYRKTFKLTENINTLYLPSGK